MDEGVGKLAHNNQTRYIKHGETVVLSVLERIMCSCSRHKSADKAHDNMHRQIELRNVMHNWSMRKSWVSRVTDRLSGAGRQGQYRQEGSDGGSHSAGRASSRRSSDAAADGEGDVPGEQSSEAGPGNLLGNPRKPEMIETCQTSGITEGSRQKTNIDL
eukprot:scaffold246294_cov42-Prasinocladus_malaysianus.AAC.2